MPFDNASYQPPFSLSGFLHFCESKPPAERYAYYSSEDWRNCAINQYRAAHGKPAAYIVIPESVGHVGPDAGGVTFVNMIADPFFGKRTYGALAERLRAYMATHGIPVEGVADAVR